MYLLGHMALGYTLAWVIARSRKQKLILWAVLTAGILPDFDLLFSGLGLVHESYTHSLLIWAPVVIGLILWSRDTLPYVTALLSHMLGDLVIGSLTLFLPLSGLSFGLTLGMGSVADAVLEISLLAVMTALLASGGDLRRLLDGGKVNILVVVPLVSILGLNWVAAREIGVSSIEGLVAYGFSTTALQMITMGQILLGGLMTASIAIAAYSLFKLVLR